MCATKREDEMSGKLRCLYRQTMSLWAVASGGCTPGVKELARKGIREARCRPPRCGAWLRDRKVSSNEVGFNLREKAPLPRNILHSLVRLTRIYGAATEPKDCMVPKVTEAG